LEITSCGPLSQQPYDIPLRECRDSPWWRLSHRAVSKPTMPNGARPVPLSSACMHGRSRYMHTYRHREPLANRPWRVSSACGEVGIHLGAKMVSCCPGCRASPATARSVSAEAMRTGFGGIRGCRGGRRGRAGVASRDESPGCQIWAIWRRQPFRQQDTAHLWPFGARGMPLQSGDAVEIYPSH